MKTNMPKIVRCLVPVGFLFVGFFLDPVIVLAERREPRILRAKETINKFLSSVELGESDYSFTVLTTTAMALLTSLFIL
jgi:hypothetical protein